MTPSQVGLSEAVSGREPAADCVTAADLRAARLNRGLTIKELAEQMGVSQFVLRAAETGSKPKLPSDALKIAEFFGRKPTELWEV